MVDSYADVASEYYQSRLHPTCADFGIASFHLIEQWFKKRGELTGTICEVGSGLSCVLRAVKKCDTLRVIITDASYGMLEHSRTNFSCSAEFLVCNAEEISSRISEVDILVSSLGDPYNSAEFWTEVSRVLSKSGQIIFTTPSFEWAAAFRKANPQEKNGYALFETIEGKKLYLRSDIRTEEQQIELIARAGLGMVEIVHYTLEELKTRKESISSKITQYISDQTPVITGYIVKSISH